MMLTPRNCLTSLIMAAGLSACVSVVASGDVSDLARQAEQIRANSQAYVDEALLVPRSVDDDVMRLAQEIIDQAPEKFEQGRSQVMKSFDIELPEQPAADAPDGEWIDILVSRSLGDSVLSQIIASVENTRIPVRLVFRGIGEGQKLNDAFAEYGRWSKGLENPPSGIIDPTVFQTHDVNSVPRMIYMKDGEALASVDGLTNPVWLSEQVETGQRGHLGVRGPVEEIAERDLIELMQERMAKVDFQARRQQTVDSYWQRANFFTLSPAQEHRRREIDPTIVVNQALKDANGKVLVPAGTHINPLHMRDFTLRLVVFNPNRKAELDWVSSLIPVEGREDMFIATELNREDGWQQLESVQDRLDAPVYMLKPDLLQRFELQRTPSLVTSSGVRFVVEEYKVSNGGNLPGIDEGEGDAH